MNNEDDLIDEEVGVEEAPVPAPASATETKSMSIAGVTIDETQLPIFVVLVASIVLLIATGAEYDWKIKVCMKLNMVMLDSSPSYSVCYFCLLKRKLVDTLDMPSPSHPLLWSFPSSVFSLPNS